MHSLKADSSIVTTIVSKKTDRYIIDTSDISVTADLSAVGPLTQVPYRLGNFNYKAENLCAKAVNTQ